MSEPDDDRLAWLDDPTSRDIRLVRKMYESGCRPDDPITARALAAMLDIAENPTRSPRDRTNAVNTIRLIQKQMFDQSLAIAELIKPAAPVTNGQGVNVNINMGEHEKRAHFDAIIERGIADGSFIIEPDPGDAGQVGGKIEGGGAGGAGDEPAKRID